MGDISIVIPLYNKAQYISRAINSVLQQTAQYKEILVIDDGSTDGGGELVQNFKDPRLHLIRQENSGVSAARNLGFAKARGELIAFLDADDAWNPRFLEVILHLKQKFPQAGAFATAYTIINPGGAESKPKFNFLPPNAREGIIENYFRNAYCLPVCSSSVAVSKRVLEQIGGFPVGESLSEDLDTWLRIALRYDIAWSSERLSYYHKNALNRVAGFRFFEHEPIVSRSARLAIASGLVSPDQLNDLREYAAYNQIITALHFLATGKKEQALQMLNYACGTRRFARRWWMCRLAASVPINIGSWFFLVFKIRQLLRGN